MLQKLLLLIVMVLSLISSQVYASGIQKWIDVNGQVHYGDTPPPQIQTQTIKTNKRPSVLGKPLPRFTGSSSGSTSTKSPNKQRSVDDTLEPAQAAVACKNAKEDLKVIKNSSRIQLRSADGSLRYMTTEEIKQRRQRSEEAISRFCR